MTPRLSLIVFIVILVFNLAYAGHHGGGHHHHVIIHVPYKVHTIHHTITKHVHHQDQGDKYEVIGYTVGKPIDIGHQLGGGHEEMHQVGHHEFGGGNELGHGHGLDFAPSLGQHSFAGGGGGGGSGGHLEGYADVGAGHEYSGHAGFGGYE